MSIGNDTQVGRVDIPVGGVPINVAGGDQTFEQYPRPPRGVYVATTGDLKVDLADGSTGLVYANMTPGQDFGRAIVKIYQVGTTITGVVHF